MILWKRRIGINYFRTTCLAVWMETIETDDSVWIQGCWNHQWTSKVIVYRHHIYPMSLPSFEIYPCSIVNEWCSKQSTEKDNILFCLPYLFPSCFLIINCWHKSYDNCFHTFISEILAKVGSRLVFSWKRSPKMGSKIFDFFNLPVGSLKQYYSLSFCNLPLYFILLFEHNLQFPEGRLSQSSWRSPIPIFLQKVIS